MEMFLANFETWMMVLVVVAFANVWGFLIRVKKDTVFEHISAILIEGVLLAMIFIIVKYY